MVKQQHMHIRNALRAYVVDNFLYMQPDREFSDDAPLIRSGVIDSLGILEVVAFVEETWNVTVDVSGITESNFGSIASIAEFVAHRAASSVVEVGVA